VKSSSRVERGPLPEAKLEREAKREVGGGFKCHKPLHTMHVGLAGISNVGETDESKNLHVRDVFRTGNAAGEFFFRKGGRTQDEKKIGDTDSMFISIKAIMSPRVAFGIRGWGVGHNNKRAGWKRSAPQFHRWRKKKARWTAQSNKKLISEESEWTRC